MADYDLPILILLPTDPNLYVTFLLHFIYLQILYKVHFYQKYIVKLSVAKTDSNSLNEKRRIGSANIFLKIYRPMKSNMTPYSKSSVRNYQPTPSMDFEDRGFLTNL